MDYAFQAAIAAEICEALVVVVALAWVLDVVVSLRDQRLLRWMPAA